VRISAHRETHTATTFLPTLYRGRTQLTLPLHVRFLVQDGHDFDSHHRRLDYVRLIAQQYGIGTSGLNFMRYADDQLIAPSIVLKNRHG